MVSKEIYGICRGSLIFAPLHYNFKILLMGILEKLESSRIFLDSGIRLDSGRMNAWNLDAWTMEALSWDKRILGPKKLKFEIYRQSCSRGGLTGDWRPATLL